MKIKIEALETREITTVVTESDVDPETWAALVKDVKEGTVKCSEIDFLLGEIDTLMRSGDVSDHEEFSRIGISEVKP